MSDPTQTTDAVVWATEFQRIARSRWRFRRPLSDTGWLIGWFANAIETGRAAGARPFGGRGEVMTGHEVAARMDEGEVILVKFGIDGDTTWERADRITDDHPEGIPADWYRQQFGQINLIVEAPDA